MDNNKFKYSDKNMAKQLKLTVEQFDRLLNCPLKRDEYEEILRSQSVI